MASASNASVVWDAEVSADRSKVRTGYIKELDGLRAFSALIVVVYHTLPTKLPGAFIGVDVFFVISGFLITTILANEIEKSGTVRFGRFYWRRFLRLAPALWLMVVGVMLIALIAFFALHRTPPFPLSGEGRSAFFALTYVINWTRAYGVLPDSMFGHAWSLAIEQQFYVLWPALLLGILGMVGRDKAWQLVLGLLLAVVAWRTAMVLSDGSPVRIYNGFDTRADTLLAGCLLALLPLASLASLGRLAGRWIWVPIAVMGGITLVAHYDGYVSQLVGATVTMVAAGWIVLGVIDRQGTGPLSALLCWAPINYLGRISYGFYLWHFPISLTIGQTFGGGLPNLVITFVLSFLLAAASFHFVEEPIMRRSKRVA